jgi:hypothetical protein
MLNSHASVHKWSGGWGGGGGATFAQTVPDINMTTNYFIVI